MLAAKAYFTGSRPIVNTTKLRLGRERIEDDLATITAVRKSVGDDMKLMVDFNQGLHFGEALERCHMIDDLGLAWIEEPIVYDNFRPPR
jgi:mandelate racemase